MSGYYVEGPMSNWIDDRDMALLEKYRVWILDRKETLSCMTPFDLWCLQHNYDNRGLQYGHEALAIPGCKGYDCRLKDGWVYVAVIPTTDEEKAQREILCAERLAPWIEDFDREYQKYKDELMGRYYLPFQAIDMESLEDYQLQDAFDDWIELYRRGGNYHMVWLLAFAKIYTMFDELCQKEAGFGVDDPLFSDLMAGFEQKMMEGDRGLFKLGVRARELGLEPLFNEIQGQRRASCASSIRPRRGGPGSRSLATTSGSTVGARRRTGIAVGLPGSRNRASPSPPSGVSWLGRLFPRMSCARP